MIFNTFFKRLFKTIPGPIFGMLTFVFAILSHLLGLLFYQEYDISVMAISELANGELGWIYRAGLIIAVILSIPFIIYLASSIEESKPKGFKIAFLITGLIYAISIVFVGVFWKENSVTMMIHGFFALIAWINGFLLTMIFSILMIFERKHPNSLIFFGFIISGAFLAHLILFNPISQWIMTLGIIFWIWIISSYFLYKKR